MLGSTQDGSSTTEIHPEGLVMAAVIVNIGVLLSAGTVGCIVGILIGILIAILIILED